MDNDVTFGEWLRRHRRGLDLTQQELAHRLGCGVTTIRKMEAGERRPSKHLATQLAVSLEIAPEEYGRFITFARAGHYSDRPPPSAVRLPGISSADTVKISSPPFLAQSTASEKPPPTFVTRERELAELETALETARTGQGQIRFVIGGAGRGKTMLVQEFARRAQEAKTDLLVISGFCNAHTGLGDPYLPFREALTMLMGEVSAKWAAGLITTAHARPLWESMPLTMPALVKQAPDLIGSFVPAEPLLERAAIFTPPDAPWFQHLMTLTAPVPSASLQQRQILAQYMGLLKTVAAERPVLLILEDLQWVDAPSISLLFHLSREMVNDRILIVGSYRPEEVVLSRDEGHHPLANILGELKRRYGDIWLDLSNLAPAEEQRFVEAYLDTEPNRMDRVFREALFRQTGGHPLFTVELLREMQARGDVHRDEEGYWLAGQAITWTKLPARVEGVIEQRLSWLSTELRATLIVASVEGDTFTAEVAARIQQVDERGLVQQLSQELDKQHRLITAQALDRVGQQRLSLYRFRHHLFQHYLYQSLDELERAYLHEAVGMALEDLYGRQTEAVAVQLARHFEQAGLTEKAVSYLLQAGQRAGRLSASKEAIAHLSRGLALLQSLPDTPERTPQELEFQIALGNALLATKGFAAPEVGQAYRQAQALCQKIGETAQLFPVLHGLHRFYLLRGELTTAREVGEQMLNLAQGRQDPLLLVPAHRVLETSLWFQGEFGQAQAHLEQALALYESRQHPIYVSLYGLDEGVVCLVDAGCVLWFLGYPDQAIQRSGEAISLAQKLAHPFSLALAMNLAILPHQLRRETQRVQEQAEVAVAFLTKHGFAHWLAVNAMYQGWGRAVQKQEEAGITQMRQGLAAYQTTGAETVLPYFLGMLAEGYLKVGQVESGLRALSEALAVVDKNGERWCEAELYRLKGELSLKAGAMVESEDCFRQAIAIARRQQARSLELRATVSLGRLWRQQGKKGEARQMLAEIYGWFTEGFETVDLTEAKALLEGLS